MASNGHAKLERSLSLTSEPRTLTRQQYDMAVASMQAMERQQRLAGPDATAETGGAVQTDRDNGASGAAAAAEKLPA